MTTATKTRPAAKPTGLDWYHAALAGQNPAVHEDAPQCGYFRYRKGKDEPWLAAAIWAEGTVLHCQIGQSRNFDAKDMWLSLARNPIPKDAAMAWFKTGKWAGEFTVENTVPAADRPVTSTDNQPPEAVTDGDKCLREIEAKLETARDFVRGLGKGGKIAKLPQADKAGEIVAELRKLATRAKAIHAEEKGPHLRKCKEIDERYNPKIKQLGTAKDHLLGLAEAFVLAEQAKAQEAQLKAAAQELQTGTPAAEPPFDPPEAPKLGGNAGRALSLHTVTTAKITDHTKALQHFAQHADVIELVRTLAERALRAGHEVPGAELTTEQVLR